MAHTNLSLFVPGWLSLPFE